MTSGDFEEGSIIFPPGWYFDTQIQKTNKQTKNTMKRNY